MTRIRKSEMHPEVSVVVPTYKRPEKLNRALSSVAASVQRAHEVLVIDDCPEGSGFEVARRHGARYVFKAGLERGHSCSRNIGIQWARGEFLVFLDDDDLLCQGALGRLIDHARASAGMVFGDYCVFNDTDRVDVRLDQLDMERLLVCNQIPMGAYVIPAALVTRDFDPQLRSHEDWDFLLFHAQRMRLSYLEGCVVAVDKTDNQKDSTEARRRKLFWLDFLAIYARYPAPHLAEARSAMLQTLGMQVPEALLQNIDVI